MEEDKEIASKEDSSSSLPVRGVLEYYSARQGDKLVEEYTNEFDRLQMRCNVKEEGEQRIARYLGGLRTVTSNVMHL